MTSAMPSASPRISLRQPDGSLRITSSLSEAFPGPWLVVSPHDDDIVLGLGLTAALAQAQGIAVHVAVATDGALGYVELEDRAGLVATRRRELLVSMGELGLPEGALHRFELPDGSLIARQGCRGPGEPPALGQHLVALMRKVRPSTVFVCTQRDVHPDHRVAASETAIACVWAASRIWLELGTPIAAPALCEYAVYCPFESAPHVEVMADAAMLECKLRALAAFESQGVIDDMVARLRADGPFEYIRRVPSEPYRPSVYRGSFER
jgi:LmbE family N-acetylglucosaminyl deacetylase